MPMNYVYNNTTLQVDVWCTNPSNDKEGWGPHHHIGPGRSQLVYQRGPFERDARLHFHVYNKPGPTDQKIQILLFSTDFETEKDVSWIVDYDQINSSNHGGPLNSPDGKYKHAWKLLPEEMRVSNVVYNMNPATKIVWKPDGVKSVELYNKNKNETSLQANLSASETESRNWTNKIGFKVGFKSTIKTGIPFVLEGKVEVSAETSYEHTWGEAISQTTTFTGSVSVKCPPKTATHCSMTLQGGEMKIPYTAHLAILYKGGKVKDIGQITGEYSGVSMTNVDIVVDESVPIPKNASFTSTQPHSASDATKTINLPTVDSVEPGTTISFLSCPNGAIVKQS